MINFLILGSSCVGKTSLIKRFSNDSFSNSYQPTTCITSEYKAIEYNNKTINLQIWDTFEDMNDFQTRDYLTRASGVILVFAVDDRESFDKIKSWMDIVKQNCKNDIGIALVGTKSDIIQRVVTTKEAEKIAETYNIQYYELSAKENIKVNEPFIGLIQQHEARNSNIIDKQNENILASEIKEYLHAFKAEIYSKIEESRKSDKQELAFLLKSFSNYNAKENNEQESFADLQDFIAKEISSINTLTKASLDELQTENKTILERISRMEKRNRTSKSVAFTRFSAIHESGMPGSVGEFDENAQDYPNPKGSDNEIIELRQRIQESEERLTHALNQIDIKLKSITPRENNLKVSDMTHLYSPLARVGKIEYEFPKIVEEDTPDYSELKRVQSDHLKPPIGPTFEKSKSTRAAGGWRGRFDLTIKTPDSVTPKNKTFSIVDGLDEEHKNYRNKVHNYVNSESILKDQATPKKGGIHHYDEDDGALLETSYDNKQNQVRSLRSRYMDSHLDGNESLHEHSSSHRLEEVNPIPSIQEEIGFIWKTINTIIENTQDQIEKLKASLENKPLVINSPRLEASLPTEPKKEDQPQEKDKEANKEDVEEKVKGIYDGKDLKTILKEVKDDVHNQILGVQREFDRELLALRDTLLGHYTAFSQKIELEHVGVKKYLDDAIEYIKAELHEVIGENHNNQMLSRDRSMSDGNILLKFAQRQESANINIDANQSKQAEKDNNLDLIQKQLYDGLMRNVWETINLIASRLQKVEKSVNAPQPAAPVKGKVK